MLRIDGWRVQRKTKTNTDSNRNKNIDGFVFFLSSFEKKITA
jgi:hypothetical protein